MICDNNYNNKVKHNLTLLQLHADLFSFDESFLSVSFFCWPGRSQA